MTIGTKDFSTQVNISIACSGTTANAINYLQLTSISKDFDGHVYSVANTASLPSATNNKGRMIYILDTCSYRISDGAQWTNNFTSTLVQSSDIYVWGNNGSGILGDGTTIGKSSPVLVAGGFTDWCQVGAGSQHSLGVRTGGTLWAWGVGFQGRLGDGTTIGKSSPVLVAGGFTDWCQASAGYAHSLAVRSNGTAWAWGYGGMGRLGDNAFTDRSSPVSVVGGFTDWCQVSAGHDHSLGVRTNGTAWAWGCNGNGKLGDGTTIFRCSPVSVVGGYTDWCQVSAGHLHSLGVRTTCHAMGWGNNTQGRLGDGNTTSSRSPVFVVGGAVWCQVSAGRNHSLGVRTAGTAWGWGYNGQGRLGDGTTTIRCVPTTVVGGFTDWCQVSAGYNQSHGVRTNGTAWSWGAGGQGQLGDGTTISKSSPVSVAGGFTDWSQVSAGCLMSAAVRSQSRGF